MPVTIDGTSGVSLVQDSIITASKLSLTANSAPIMTALNASGSAPIYACRAWVNFNGTGTVAIRASGNVSSITDNGNGDYTVNFTNAMTDANYCIAGTGSGYTTNMLPLTPSDFTTARTASAARFVILAINGGAGVDCVQVGVAIFR
jgi:hypothetical protein